MSCFYSKWPMLSSCITKACILQSANITWSAQPLPLGHRSLPTLLPLILHGFPWTPLSSPHTRRACSPRNWLPHFLTCFPVPPRHHLFILPFLTYYSDPFLMFCFVFSLEYLTWFNISFIYIYKIYKYMCVCLYIHIYLFIYKVLIFFIQRKVHEGRRIC